jgi:hypothetical protein
MELDRKMKLMVSDGELKKFQQRSNLFEKVIKEVEGDVEVVKLSGGDVVGWLNVDVWKKVLVCNGLSDEGKYEILMKCVKEKVKYPNMGEKSTKYFIDGCLNSKLYDEKKKEQPTTPQTGEVVNRNDQLLHAA